MISRPTSSPTTCRAPVDRASPFRTSTAKTTYFASDELKNADFWKQVSGSFTTGPDTKLLLLRMQRDPPGMPIRGKLWIDTRPARGPGVSEHRRQADMKHSQSIRAFPVLTAPVTDAAHSASPRLGARPRDLLRGVRPVAVWPSGLWGGRALVDFRAGSRGRALAGALDHPASRIRRAVCIAGTRCLRPCWCLPSVSPATCDRPNRISL